MRLSDRKSGATRHVLAAAFLVAGIVGVSPATAQPGHPQHHHPPPADDDPGAALCPTCPVGRAAANTSWQPDATPAHGHSRAVGGWLVSTHVLAALAATTERGPRGGDATFAPGHVMINARRRAGRGVFGIQSMWTPEPLMGARGYPLLTQTGETSDGVTPLVDRQHPHDLPMELAATYARALGDDRSFHLYVAAVGAPALGPPAFMHRRSAARLPLAPIGHHWFDSTHVSFGVVTVGLSPSRVAKFEISAFRGREPDHRRWGFESPRLDSISVRLSVNPRPSLSIQASAGALHEPEPLHPDANVGRMSTTVMYTGRWRGLELDAFGGWARNNRTASTVPVEGGVYFYPGGVSHALLGEATLRLGIRHAVMTRVEYVQKDELYPLPDPRHSIRFPVRRAVAGYALDVASVRGVTLAVGGAASWIGVSQASRPDYGGPPAAFLAFIDVRTH